MHDFRLVDYDIHNFVFNSSQLFLLVSFAVINGKYNYLNRSINQLILKKLNK